MSIFRGLLFLCLIASALCFVGYVVTRKPHYRRWGTVILKWALFAAFAFFAVLGVTRWMGW